MAASASDRPAPAASLAPQAAAEAPGAALGRISIIICTKDRRADLDRAVAAIAAGGAAGRPAELVIVEETDAPRPVPGATYVPIPRDGRGFGYARNRGIAAAGGDLLVFVDDDCEVRPGWLPALLAPFDADRSLAGTAGAVLVRDTNLVGYAENILGFPGGGLRYLAAAGGHPRETRHLSTCNCAYRRAAIEAAGGFPRSAVWGGEDALLAERVTARGRCLYVPQAAVYHRPRGSLRAVFRWFVRRGRSEIQILPHRLDRRARLRNLVWTSLVVRAGVLAVVLPLLPLPVPVSLGGVLVAYCGVNLWRHRFALRFDPHRRAWPLVPLVKLVMDAGMEAGKLRELAAGLGRRGRA